MHYRNLLEHLFGLASGRRGRYDLTAMRELCRRLGEPQEAFATVHVAGTNGKGSVATILAAGLRNHHAPVGLYTSPHIATFRERIQVDGVPITVAEVEELLPPILEIAQRHVPAASFFEVTTALAFRYYASRGVAIAVIEAGLGGRLDATNVITPQLAVITSISLEHTELLGTSLDAIAREKGGIIKPQVPVVIGPTVPYESIAAITASLQAPLHHVAASSCTDYRRENAYIAHRALTLLGIEDRYITPALAALPPCRFQRHTTPSGTHVLFDVAHNPAGLQRLAALMQTHYPKRPCHAVVALSSTKELHSSLLALSPCVRHWYPVAASNGRSYPPDTLATYLAAHNPATPISLCGDIPAAVTTALANADADDAPLLICGSFFIMAAARYTLGIDEAHDPHDLNELFHPNKL